MTDNLQERNQQVLENISQLQTQEKEFYKSLDDPSLTSDQKQQIINKINEISQMRLNMYAGMQNMYSYYQQNVSASRSTLGQEMTAIDIIENELNQSKKKLNLIQDQKYNKLRLVEINTYYGKRYIAHTQLMKTIVYTCIPLMIFAILANKGILPPKLYRVLSAIILIIGVIVLGGQLIDMSNRDNLNWDEYNWYFNEADAPSGDGSEATNPWDTPSATCIGSACCYEGSTYDESKNICVPNEIYTQQNPPTSVSETTNPNPDSTSESFISGQILGKYGATPVKPISLNTLVMPSYSSLTKF
jgi:hypothetical protein